jgi:hypothetical protein
MRLTLRRTGGLSPVYQDQQDWTVLDGGREVGRIYEDRSASAPPDLRWFWSVTVYVPPSLGVRTSNKVGSLAEAKRCFLKAWEAVQAQAL